MQAIVDSVNSNMQPAVNKRSVPVSISYWGDPEVEIAVGGVVRNSVGGVKQNTDGTLHDASEEPDSRAPTSRLVEVER